MHMERRWYLAQECLCGQYIVVSSDPWVRKMIQGGLCRFIVADSNLRMRVMTQESLCLYIVAESDLQMRRKLYSASLNPRSNVDPLPQA
jgi:hypothetical protein